MKLFRVMVAGVAAAGMLVSGAPAQNKDKEPTKEEIAKAEHRGAVVADLSLSADLANFGREAKSPESLVIAGGMLLRAHKSFGGKTEALDVKPVDEKGNPVKGDAVKTTPLDEQAKELFDEARAMAAGDKTRSASLEALIKTAQTFGWGSDNEARGACGGPRRITRMLQPGETHTLPITFVGGSPATVCMTSSGPPRIQFDITHVSGAVITSQAAFNWTWSWTPARDADGLRKFNITLRNLGRRPTTYTVTTN